MIKKPNELDFSNKKLAMIIAGVPGIGKTTLALSAPKPLLIDLDKGVSRVEARYRTDTAEVSTFGELENDLKNNDLSSYETIVIDTGGKLLEMLKPVVIADDPKNGKRDGNLSLQGYGAVKRKFNQFVNFVKGLDKNIVIVFHATEVALADDITGLRIRMEGGAKDEVWDDIDVGGFVEMNGKKRTIGFSNCQRYYAKGTHGIHGVYELPVLEKGSKNTFVSDLFTAIKNDLNKAVDETTEYKEIMNELMPRIKSVSNVDELNDITLIVADAKHCLTSKDELKFAIKEKAKELGAKYDKVKGRFE